MTEIKCCMSVARYEFFMVVNQVEVLGWSWRQLVSLKCWYPTTTLRCATVQKTSTWIACLVVHS